VRVEDTLTIFLNGTYANKVQLPPAAFERVGVFIAGQLAVEFRDFTLRVKQKN
jgi:hypothetical protein